jgi:hypothetical protein
MLCWWLKNDTYLPSINSPKLTLCSSLSKDKLSDRLGVATMLSRLKSTHAFKQKLSSGLERTILTLNLPILPFTMGLVDVTWVLSSWKTERLSQALCLKLFDQPLFWSFAGFSNKTQRFLCMTLSRLSFMVFLDPRQGILWCMSSLFSQNMWYFWHKA